MIFEALNDGVTNGTSRQELMDLYGIKSIRQFQTLVRNERLQGKPILERNGQYFKSDDPTDYKIWAGTALKKGAHTIEVVQTVMKHCPADDGQFTIDYFLTPNHGGSEHGSEKKLHSSEI